MANYDSNDLDWTWDGDFIIGENGDLQDTADDFIRSLETEVRTIVRSEFSDWEKHPVLGTNLSDFRGEPNTRETAEAMKSQIISRLVASGIVKRGDVTVRIVPTGPHEVLVMIRIAAASTPGNRLEVGENLVISFSYDSLEDSIFFLPVNQLERDAR